MKNEPEWIDPADITLPPDVEELTERLAREVHGAWARQRLANGWRYGPERNDARREHPCILPYDELSVAEKEYDRTTAIATLKTILALGYRIEKVLEPHRASNLETRLGPPQPLFSRSQCAALHTRFLP